MVQRTSQEVNLTPKGPTPTYTGPSIGMVAPNVAEKTVLDQKTGAEDRTLQSILGDWQPLMKQGLRNAQEEAYLAGASKAAGGESQDAVEGNIMTRDWANAGYRDVSGKLAMATEEAKFTEDLKTLRGESPEKLQEYLATRRATLMPSLEGMSREQRVAAFGQMMLSDRSAIATHTTEHIKYQIEQKTKTVQTEFATAKSQLDASLQSESKPQYKAALDNWGGKIYGSILMEPSFTPEMKSGLVVEAAKGALSTGNVQAYTYLRDTQVPDGKGGVTTILGTLSMHQQTQLSDAHYAATQKVDAIANLDHSRQLSIYEASLKDNTFSGTLQDVYALQERHVKLFPKDDAGGKRILDSYLDWHTKYKDNTKIMADGIAGNKGALFAANVTDADVVGRIAKDLSDKKRPIEEQLGIFTKMALEGNAASAKHLGGSVGSLVQGLEVKNGAMSPESSIMLGHVMRTVDSLKAEGKENSLATFYAGMPDAQAIRLQRLIAKDVMSAPASVLTHVLNLEAKEANEPASQKKARLQKDEKAHTKFVNGLDSHGDVVSAIANYTPWGRTSEQAKLSPKTSFWTTMNDNTQVTAKITGNAKDAWYKEYENIRMLDPDMSPKDVTNMAIGKVMNRTVSTPDAPFIVQEGMTPQWYFKTNGSNEQIGIAISKAIPKATPEGRMVYTAAQGKIIYTEYSKDGRETLNSGEVPIKDVRDKVTELIDGKRAASNEAVGNGFGVGLGGKMVFINGANTASMSPDTMVTIRKNLSRFEGFSDKPKPDVGGRLKADGTPVMTTGIGISDTNTYYKQVADPSTTPEQHAEIFKMATNEAARDATKLNARLGLRGSSWDQLSTELIYQSGIGNVVGGTKTKQDQSYAALYTNKDPSKTIDLVKATPAYRMSADPKNPTKMTGRQRHYIALAQQIEADGTINSANYGG